MKSVVRSVDSGLHSAFEPCDGGSFESPSEFVAAQEESSNTIPAHPLGVKPSGNQYTAALNSRICVGATLGLLPDELLGTLLEYLDVEELLVLESSCKFLYAFCRADDLWKALFLLSPQSRSGSFQWRGTWRSTLLGFNSLKQSLIKFDSVFSDVLYRPFLCTHTSLAPYASHIPQRNSIPRLEDLSAEEFSRSWSDRPFILTAPVRQWPAYNSWSIDTLLEKYGDVKFRAEAVDWTLRTYVSYMRDSADESPLYLFDRAFVSKMNIEPLGEKQPCYWPPKCFGEDLFAVLGDERPDDKWLIVGPARSGSTYHKDPNATSAWNAVLRGSKYWIMFPSTSSSPPPPGVYVSEDQSEVTSPLSIAEWLLGFHAEARKTPGCVEGVCREGEVLHVPSGWWHLVVNLDASIAITQNFVPYSHLAEVLSFLKDKPDQVSGFKKHVSDPYGTFVERLRGNHPDLLKRALEELNQKAEGRKRKWDSAIGEEEGGEREAFIFGFGGDSDEEIL